MNIKNRIWSLYKKLKDESLSRSEYEEFLSYSENEDLKTVFEDILEGELESHIPIEATHSIDTGKRFYIGKWYARIGGVAAAFTLLLLSSYFFWPQPDQPDIVYTTTNGERQEIILPDQSTVVLNANSSLTWMESEEVNMRMVKLSGEAYFDVKSMPKKPFRVYSNEMIIEVLGTSFNINNRENRDEVFLEEGTIRILGQHDEKDTLLLNTGESAHFNPQYARVEKTDDKQLEARAKWKDGILQFRNLPVREILAEIRHVYGVSIKLGDSELLEKPMDFALPYSNWDVMHNALSLALGTELIVEVQTNEPTLKE